MSHNFSASSWVSMLTKLAPNCCWQTAWDSCRDVKCYLVLWWAILFDPLKARRGVCAYLPWQSPPLQSAALQLSHPQPAGLAAVPHGGVLQPSVAQADHLPRFGQLWKLWGAMLAISGAPVSRKKKTIEWNSYIKLQAENVRAAEDSFNLFCSVSIQTKLTLQALIFPISESQGGGTALRLKIIE